VSATLLSSIGAVVIVETSSVVGRRDARDDDGRRATTRDE
jgi:hypothetical protein